MNQAVYMIKIAILIFSEKEGEHSIPNNCFTWRNTDLRCDYASEIPMGIAVFSRKKYKRRLTWLWHLRGNSWYLEMWIWNLDCVIKVVMDLVLLNHFPHDWKKVNKKRNPSITWIKCLRKEKEKEKGINSVKDNFASSVGVWISARIELFQNLLSFLTFSK